jgi:hypothetical protein
LSKIHDPSIRLISEPPDGFPSGLSLDVLQPRIVVGETSQALLEVQFIPREWISKAFKEDIREMALREKLR